MSRTDKDRPWQIRAADLTDHNNRAYFWHHETHHIREGGCGVYCEWTLPHTVLHQLPSQIVRVLWNGPERQRERTGLRRMALEYNAFGDIDDGDFVNRQHRHGVKWLCS
jgi:hypothetical protein